VAAQLTGLCIAAVDVISQMPYIDAVIKEVIRLHDPATLVFRRALEDIVVDDNLVIPKVPRETFDLHVRLRMPGQGSHVQVTW